MDKEISVSSVIANALTGAATRLLLCYDEEEVDEQSFIFIIEDEMENLRVALTNFIAATHSKG
jgi:hypothetical protein